ncbi:hypothetical protein DW1_1131 [Proteiniborus sp. DW1]|uniref:helix-turn-helix domain-containing protein n=1 Tax=Proteiniborus sp. DW1 TaxID=1889883 RepID=UPI00092E0F20|nr:helix-turn-helix domain-containing protein [Proteiniborus sp. DW1]SCG82704.1 hypothetical protein DW1_1131 [Proteiniborus sp. DW1]
MTKKELDAEIIALHKQGLNGREIARKLFISQTKATRTIQEYKEKVLIAVEMVVAMYFKGIKVKDAIEQAKEVLGYATP